MQQFHPENLDWIPKDPQSSEEQQFQQQPVKRRRLRKRKRRPPVLDESAESSEERPLIRRRIRPQRLDQMDDNLDGMNEEDGKKPHIRRRITPVYYSESAEDRPMTATIRVAEEQTTENTEDNLTLNRKEQIKKPDLKSLLKQSGGTLSLSEILQQKNLSLSELLMGNEKAISALTEPTTTTTTSTITEEAEVVKYSLPPSIGLRKTINRNFEQLEDSVEMLTPKETVEAQRKRLALLHNYKENKLFKEVSKFEVVTEPTTEKRIFVPSHPKYYTSLNFKPDFSQFTVPTTEIMVEETTPIITTTTATTTTQAQTKISFTRLNLKPKLKSSLPMTNAKLNKMVNKLNTNRQEVQKQSEIKPIKIDIQEIFGIKAILNKTTPKPVVDEPFKMKIDIEAMIEKTTTLQPETTTKPTKMSKEKLKLTAAKEEIMEILRDPIGREKLARILEIRNMTIQQLVEQRERGSSQLHLADIFHNKTREPDPKDERLVIGHISSEYFSSFPIFGRKQKSRTFADETTTNQPTQNIDNKSKDTLSVTSFPTYKIELEKSLKETQPFLWKELYPDFLAKIYESNNKKLKPIEKITTEMYPENEIQHLDDIENKFSEVSNERLLNVNLHEKIFENSNNVDEVLIHLPSGVKSAILASLAIIALSLIVFVSILMMFKWTQKKKTRLNYCSTLSSKIKTPILVQGTGKNIKTFMTETLGRKKGYYKQSLPENIWENERKSSY